MRSQWGDVWFSLDIINLHQTLKPRCCHVTHPAWLSQDCNLHCPVGIRHDPGQGAVSTMARRPWPAANTSGDVTRALWLVFPPSNFKTNPCLIIPVLHPKNPGHELTQVSHRLYQNQRERLDPLLQEPKLSHFTIIQRYFNSLPRNKLISLPCMPEKTEASALQRAPPHLVGAVVMVSGVSTEHLPRARHCVKCACHYLTYSL